MWSSAILFALACFTQISASSSGDDSGLPVGKVYGVNLGSWLLLEPWMLPNEWARMEGESCSPCSVCAASEFDLVKKLGQEKADEVFQQHWETWFTQKDVDDIVDAGLNTVRLPMGYWIIEDLVDRQTEFYARGGIKQLKRGLQQLKSAGINVLLDFHAMPGVSSANQMFAGRCTSDVQFYTPPNYFRALQWAAVTTFFTHVDPSFSKVFGIEAVNEPLMDSTKTPGYGDYLVDFTRTIRAVELLLGIICPDVDYGAIFGLDVKLTNGNVVVGDVAIQANASLSSRAAAPLPLARLAPQIGGRVGEVLLSIIPILPHVASQLGLDNPLDSFWRLRGDVNRKCLHATFMDDLWQNTRGFNPAGAKQGPALFDDHLYFSFGGVANPDAESYLSTICKLPRVQSDTSLGNLPMVFGEWSLATNFAANDTFLNQWADAQKLMYSQSSGWIFWSFKIEDGSSDQREWDYFTALKSGHFTRDPAKLNDPHVCDAFRA